MKREDYVVQVCKTPGSTPLTYRYPTPLRVGDTVLCPATEYSGGPFTATVTELGSDYQGYIRYLICRVAPDRKRP